MCCECSFEFPEQCRLQKQCLVCAFVFGSVFGCIFASFYITVGNGYAYVFGGTFMSSIQFSTRQEI